MDYINDNNLIDFTKCDVKIDYPDRIHCDTTIDVVIEEKYIPFDEINHLVEEPKEAQKKKKRKQNKKKKIIGENI